MSKQREEGFYKIKLKGVWTCGYYVNSWVKQVGFPWKVFGLKRWLKDEDFDEIGEKIEMPE